MNESRVEAARKALSHPPSNPPSNPPADELIIEEVHEVPTEFKQLVRTIGTVTTAEVEDVAVVDHDISALMEKGWEVITAQALASVPRGITVYYALVRYPSPGEAE